MKKEVIITALLDMTSKALSIATSIRNENPSASYYWHKQAELMGEAAKALMDRQGAEPETEGGGSSWWTVCGACHGQIDQDDAYCKHCGTPVLKAGEKK